MRFNQENFEREVLQSSEPVLVDFRASWCGPCRMLDPVIEELSHEANGYKVGSVDVDESPELATRYGIMSVPTVAIFRNGGIAASTVGVQTKDTLLHMLEN